jgi:Flp pilus assembly pilin Flp
MEQVLVAVDRLVRGDDGQDLIEYGMLVVLIALGAIVAVQSVGDTVSGVLWQTIAAANV